MTAADVCRECGHDQHAHRLIKPPLWFCVGCRCEWFQPEVAPDDEANSFHQRLFGSGVAEYLDTPAPLSGTTPRDAAWEAWWRSTFFPREQWSQFKAAFDSGWEARGKHG